MHRVFTLAAVCAALMIALAPMAFADDEDTHKKVRVIVTDKHDKTDVGGKFVFLDDEDVVTFGNAAEGNPSAVILEWLMEQGGENNPLARGLHERLRARGWNRDRVRGWLGQRAPHRHGHGPQVRTWRSDPHVQWYTAPPQVYRWHQTWPHGQMGPGFGMGPMGHGHHVHPGPGYRPHVDPWGMNRFHGFGMDHHPRGFMRHFGHRWGQPQPRMGFQHHGHAWGQPQPHMGFGEGSPDDMQKALEMLEQLFGGQAPDAPPAPKAPVPPGARRRGMMPPVPPGMGGMRGAPGMPGMPGMGGGRAQLEAAKRQLEMMKQQLEAWEKALESQEAAGKVNVNRADEDTLRALHEHMHGLREGDGAKTRTKIRIVTPDGRTTDFEGAPEDMKKQLEELLERMQEVNKERAKKAAK